MTVEGGQTPSESQALRVEGKFCRGCDYDLTGVWRTRPVVCPECGRGFEPDDPKTMRATPKRLERRRRVVRGAIIVVIAVVGFVAIERAWVPRPASLSTTRYSQGYSLWEWLGGAYGWDHRTNGRMRVSAWVWGDLNRPTTVVVRGPDGRCAEASAAPVIEQMRVKRVKGRWVLSVSDPTLDYNTVVGSFNATRDRLLGLTVADETQLNPNEPFTVQGDEAEILSELFRRYGVVVEPVLMDPMQPHVWVWSEEKNTLEQISVEEALARGYRLDRVSGGGFGWR